MKKTIVLLTIVLAILAAPVFAEVGASGSVEFDWAFGADDNYDEGDDNSASLSIDGAVTEYTTISVGASADDGDALELDTMMLSQDVTGALGVDGPVTFAYKMGYGSYSPKTYAEVAGYTFGGVDAEAGVKVVADNSTTSIVAGALVSTVDDYKDSSLLGATLTFGLADMVTVDVAVFPSSMMAKEARGYYDALDSALEMGINAYGTFGMVDASVYYVASVLSAMADEDGDAADGNGNMIGFNAAASVMDGLKVGAGVEVALDQKYVAADGTELVDRGMSVGTYNIDAAYTMDALTAGLSFGSMFASEDTGVSFTEASDIALSASYAVTEAFGAYAAFKTPLAVETGDLVDFMGYEVGADFTFDGVTYGFGYTTMSDFKAYDAEFTDADGAVGNVFVTVKASF